MPLNPRGVRLAFVGLTFEAAICVVYIFWALIRGHQIVPVLIPGQLIVGAILAAPLFFVNYLVFEVLAQRLSWLSQCVTFRNQVVIPFAGLFDWRLSLATSIAAGIGEECFFRGLIQTEAGVICSALLFSVLHLGRATKTFPIIAVLYFIFGLYFSWIVIFFQNLWPAAAAHALYDFLALHYMRRQGQKLPLNLGQSGNISS